MIRDVQNSNSPDAPTGKSWRQLGRRHYLTWKHGVAAAGVGALMVSSALTNPSRPAYETYATEQVSGFLLQEVCRKNLHVPQILQQALLQGCKSLSQGGKTELQQFIHQHTERYNFGLLSLYTTELPGYQLRTLGLWGHFFILSLG
jgi:hypothetical protein